MLLLTVLGCLAETIPASGYDPEYYRQSSRLSGGTWIKIRVSETGMQEISHSQLRDLGFSTPEDVTVYGYGGVRLTGQTFSPDLPDDLPSTATLHTDGKLIFYGESDVRNDLGTSETSVSVRRNAYADGGYYFLSDSKTSGSSAIPIQPYNPSAATVTDWHTSITVIEDEMECPAQAGTDFFGENLITNPGYYLKIEVTDPYALTATIRYEFASRAASTTMMSFQLPADVTVSSSYTARADGVYPNDYNYYTKGAGYHTFRLRTGPDQTYTATPQLRSSGVIEYAAVDYAGVLYRRLNSVGGKSQLRMSFFNPSGNASFRLTGTDSDTRVWNVTDPLDIYAYELHPTENQGEAIASFRSPSPETATYVEAFRTSSSLHSPEIIGRVSNQNLHALEVPDMLIVTDSTMHSYAEEVARIHRSHQGMTVHVIDQQQAYNEFSSGTTHPMGIRRLAKMFHDRDPQKFRYILLYGGGSYDNRSLILPTEGYLLTFQCESQSEMNSAATSYCSDSYFGMLSDRYDHRNIHFENMDVAVGRIPVLNTSDAANANRKIRAYFENPPETPVINRALLMCDAGDSNSHMQQIEEIADTILKYASGTTVIKAYNQLYPLTDNETNADAARRAITGALTSGVRYMAYCGHGNPNSLSFENYYQKKHIQTTSYRFFPLAMMATCDLFSFDRTNDDMGSAFIYKPDGGAAAIVAACRTVYQEHNQHLATAMAREISAASSDATTGDIFRNAHNAVAAAGKALDKKLMAINSMCYNLGGDPALPLYAPGHGVRISGLSSGSEIKPLEPVGIDGTITGADGSDATWFNGKAIVSVYGGPRTVSTYSRRGGVPADITLDQDLIAEYAAEVTAGNFHMSIIIPEPERHTHDIRLSAYAISDASGDHATATGQIAGIVLSSSPEPPSAIADTDAPVIECMYLDSPDFTDGDCVGATPVLYAGISPDQSGINIMSSGLGGIRLSLDDASSITGLQNTIVPSADGSVSISAPLGPLADGRHSLRLDISDNAGNISQRSISFIVRGETATYLTVDEYPATNEATLRISHSFPDTPFGRLVIEDASGTVVHTVENPVFPLKWDLCGSDGTRVADGEYSAYAILKSGKFHGSSARTPVIVIE